MRTVDDNAIGALFLADAAATFRSYKDLADRAIVQVKDADLQRPLNANTNSIAVIMKHMAGNMLSRWTDFLTSDGEKTWRSRDSEFIDEFTSRQEIIDSWERGWKVLFDTLTSLKPDDLDTTVTIRGEPHSVIKAVDRQIAHYGYHVGQIVLIARILTPDNWTTLTVPRGESEQFNRRTWKT